MSLKYPIYVRFKYDGKVMEGEYIPYLSDHFDTKDFVQQEQERYQKTEIYGYIRPFDRELRQNIINLNMEFQNHDYKDQMTIGGINTCDALRASDKLPSDGNNYPLASDVELVLRAELKASDEDIELCVKDILDRQLLLLDQDKALLDLRQQELAATDHPAPMTKVGEIRTSCFVLMYAYGIYVAFGESISLGILWCIVGFFIPRYYDLKEPIRRKERALGISNEIDSISGRLNETQERLSMIAESLEMRRHIECAEVEPLRYERTRGLHRWFKSKV